jgi:predicted NAD/FAD-dependent oxidoreductase
MSGRSSPSVAIIGAGMAGLSCAMALREALSGVTVFEAAAGPGGRMSTRRFDGCRFDSGAQYFTARSEAFRRQVETWCDNWLADEWNGWLVDLEAGEAMSRDDKTVRYVGRPVMQSCLEDMAELCDVRYEAGVDRAEHRNPGWALTGPGGRDLGCFDILVTAVPAPQAVPFLQPAAELAGAAAAIDTTPTWSVMLGFSEPAGLGFDGAFTAGQVLSWMARDCSKVERDPDGPETWVLHSAPEWADKNRDARPADVIETFLDEMKTVTGRDLPEPRISHAEFWPYAMPVNGLSGGCLYEADYGLGACGDWCRR